MTNSDSETDSFFRPSVDFRCYVGSRKASNLGSESAGESLPSTTLPRMVNTVIAGVAASFIFFSSFPAGFVSRVGVPGRSTGVRQTTSGPVGTLGARSAGAENIRLQALQAVKNDARELIRKIRTGEEVGSFSLRSEIERLSEVRDLPNNQTREDRAAAFILVTG